MIGEMDKAAWRAVLDTCATVTDELAALSGLEHRAAQRIGDQTLKELAGEAHRTLVECFGGPGVPLSFALSDKVAARSLASKKLAEYLAPNSR